MLNAKKANALIEGLAEAFRGEVTLRMGPLSPYPEMSFYHARNRAFVDIVTREGAERLNFTVPLRPAPGRRLFDLWVFPPRRWEELLRWVGRLDPREKASDDGRMFRLWTSEQQCLASHFQQDALFSLEELIGLDISGELAVAWTPARFLVQKPIARAELAMLARAVGLATRLMESLEGNGLLPFRAAAEEAGPQIRAGGVVWDPVVGACRVCGDDLAGRVVYCRRCSTPHHPDCWEYSGACSVYACGSTECVARLAG